MTRTTFAFSVLSVALVSALAAAPFDSKDFASEVFLAQGGQPASQERDFLSRIRRLTVEGKRAGEGYWAPDGKRLVFQSEREPGNPFYQIYVLDLTSGDTKRISPGMGKTTCAFFRPGGSEIMFASTHLDPKSKQYQDEELAFRASGKERRYAWDYDAEMDIFTFDEKTGATKRLTTAKGYDAEGGYSPDGQWIVFSSMRDAYNGTLSAADQKQLQVDRVVLRRGLHHEGGRIGSEAAHHLDRDTTAARSSPRTAASCGATSKRTD